MRNQGPFGVPRIKNLPAQASAYYISAQDEFVQLSASVAAFTAYLPLANSYSGRVLRLFRTDLTLANQITISAVGGDTIQGSTTTTMVSQYEGLGLYSDGVNWYIINRTYPATWTSFTPTGAWSTNTTYTGKWKRLGNLIHLQVGIALAGAPTTATLTVNLPTGIVVDTASIVHPSDSYIVFGYCQCLDQAAATYEGVVNYSSTTAVQPTVLNSAGTYSADYNVTQAVPITFGNLDAVSLNFQVPVVGWV